MASVGSLEEQARKRKERLMALRKKQQPEKEADEGEPPMKKTNDEEEVSEGEIQSHKTEPAFKNYIPEDEKLKGNVQPKAELVSVKEYIQDQLESSKAQPVVEEVDINNLAPRKPDWDLKRAVASKLEKLERKTQRAIAELIRERIQSGQADLADAVNAVDDRSAAKAEDEEDYD